MHFKMKKSTLLYKHNIVADNNTHLELKKYILKIKLLVLNINIQIQHFNYLNMF